MFLTVFRFKIGILTDLANYNTNTTLIYQGCGGWIYKRIH